MDRLFFARGLALLVGALLFVAGDARAVSTNHADQGLAYAKCQERMAIAQSVQTLDGSGNLANAFGEFDPNGGACGLKEAETSAPWYYCAFRLKSHSTGLPTGSFRSCETHGVGSDRAYFPPSMGCDTRPEQTGWFVDADPNTSNDVCDVGCTMEAELEIGSDGSGGYVFRPSGDTCSTAEVPPPEPDADGDGTPDADDAFPNDPNESQDSDGDGVGDNSDVAPDDATDGADDGTGDETDNAASGGGTCGTPPTCSGDGIQCNQLYQQWRTRCAVEGELSKVTGNVTSCDAAIVCQGDAIQCAQAKALQAVKCAVEGISGGGDGEFNRGPAWSGDETETGTDTAVHSDVGIGPEMFDDSGWLSRSCPAIPDFDLGEWGTFSPEIPNWCQLLDAIGALILLLGAISAIYIISR